jgi:hypothetical protein
MPIDKGTLVRVCHGLFGALLIPIVLFTGGAFALLVAWDMYGRHDIWSPDVINLLAAGGFYAFIYYYSIRQGRKPHPPARAMGWALLPAIPLIWFTVSIYFGY